MAHMIDNSKGFNAFVAFQQPAWHGLGTIFNESVTTQQALEKGGLDYKVIKMPNIHNIIPFINGIPTGEEIEIISTDSFFTYRDDVNKVLGTRLGKDYTVLQNIDALNIVDEILQSGKATIESAGALDDGKKVFICLKINKSIFVGDKDEIKQYCVIATSHDGSLATTIFFTDTRVVCNNTLRAAFKDAVKQIKVRHTTNADERLKEAAKVLKLIQQNSEVNQETFNVMANTIISPEIMMNYFGSVFCSPEEIKEIQTGKRAKDVLSTQKQNTLKDVLNYANTGKGQKEALSNGKDINLWFAYNAVTGFLTAKKYPSANDRTNSLMFGNSAKIIESAGILAAEPNKIQSMSKVNFSGLNLN